MPVAAESLLKKPSSSSTSMLYICPTAPTKISVPQRKRNSQIRRIPHQTTGAVGLGEVGGVRNETLIF